MKSFSKKVVAETTRAVRVQMRTDASFKRLIQANGANYAAGRGGYATGNSEQMEVMSGFCLVMLCAGHGYFFTELGKAVFEKMGYKPAPRDHLKIAS